MTASQFEIDRHIDMLSTSCELDRHISMLSSSFVSEVEFNTHITILPLPNEDFGRNDKRGNPDFRYTFQWFVAKIEYSRPWKVLRTSGVPLLFLLPKSSFGRGKFEAGMAYARSLTRLSCTLFNTVDPSWQHHSVRSTDTSTCHQHDSSCEVDRHISMLSSSCDSEVEFYMHITIEAWMAYARSFNTAAMHALLTRLPCTLF